jgi:cobyrinic acid a,c-diamide synthase
MTARLTLGYRDAVAATDSALAPAGLAVRGHEFHRTATSLDGAASPDGRAAPAWTVGAGREGFVRSGVHASYLHLHWAGRPGIAARVVDAAVRAAKTTREGGVFPGAPEQAGGTA